MMMPALVRDRDGQRNGCCANQAQRQCGCRLILANGGVIAWEGQLRSSSNTTTGRPGTRRKALSLVTNREQRSWMLVAACSASGVRRFRAARISAAVSQSARVVGTNRTSLELSRSRKSLWEHRVTLTQGLDHGLYDGQLTGDNRELADLGPSPHGFYQRAVGLDPFHAVDEAASVHVDWTASGSVKGSHDLRSDSR